MTGSTAVFLALTFAIAIAAGLGAFAIGRERTFEDPRALPLLLVTIWSPNIAAVAVTVAEGDDVASLVRPLTQGAPLLVWCSALIPLAVGLAVGWRIGPGIPRLALSDSVALVAMNLIMGPLGEELGWRGFLLPRAAGSGLVWAALGVGVVWALWHAPLWLLPSPHRAIPYPVFFATVISFSFVMTALWAAGDGALGPIVLYHLCANVAVGWLEFSDRASGAAAYRRSLPLHAATAGAAWLWLLVWG